MISEKLVCAIWQNQIAGDLFTDNGNHFRKIYAGRPVSGPGRDYQDAIFTIDGNLVLGDVEVHVDAREWYLHGHHRDARYNNVALHVVMWHSGGVPTVLENGCTIPTISLHSLLDAELPCDCLPGILVPEIQKARLCPVISGAGDRRALYDALKECGMRRFKAKAIYYRQALKENDAGQVLYRGMMGSLGYSRNTSAFEKLADLLPLRSLLHEAKADSGQLLALMLGTAGLLTAGTPRGKKEKCPGYAELFRQWKDLAKGPVMEEAEWCLYGIRPGNSPVRRLTAAAELLLRYRDCGLVEGMQQMVNNAPAMNFCQHLEKGIVVDRATHAEGKRQPALLGRGRAAEIIVNVILPFVYAHAGTYGKRALATKARRLYVDYPATEQNFITRLMSKSLGLSSDRRLNACRRQGLIYIFKTHCRFRDCTGCLLANNLNVRG